MTSLRTLATAAGALAERWLCSDSMDLSLADALSGAWIDGPADRLRGRSVLIATEEQFATVCAMIACDGVARRMVICPPDISADHRTALASVAEIDAVLCDDVTQNPLPDVEAFAIRTRPAPVSGGIDSGQAEADTEWVLPTSGTSGAPKLVVHTLQTLTGAMRHRDLGAGAVWSTFYDIRRYGGLQILLRALTGGGSMILSSAKEPVAAFLARAGAHGVTHMSGTPSHWRRALMSPSRDRFAPNYVRLSGEIADQSILDTLRAAFPDAAVSHAFASTEAGVAFDVTDGLAGFPAALVDGAGEVSLSVEDGSLRIRSGRTAFRYLGESAPVIRDPDGFVDTGDMVERQQDRYVFVGRRTGIINVGGLKIHPEEVEAVISDHPRVRMCVVKARSNPITGAIVTAEIVLDHDEVEPQAKAGLKDEIAALCRDRLARHKVPASIRLVPALDIAVSGKVRR